MISEVRRCNRHRPYFPVVLVHRQLSYMPLDIMWVLWAWGWGNVIMFTDSSSFFWFPGAAGCCVLLFPKRRGEPGLGSSIVNFRACIMFLLW